MPLWGSCVGFGEAAGFFVADASPLPLEGLAVGVLARSALRCRSSAALQRRAGRLRRRRLGAAASRARCGRFRPGRVGPRRRAWRHRRRRAPRPRPRRRPCPPRRRRPRAWARPPLRSGRPPAGPRPRPSRRRSGGGGTRAAAAAPPRGRRSRSRGSIGSTPSCRERAAAARAAAGVAVEPAAVAVGLHALRQASDHGADELAAAAGVELGVLVLELAAGAEQRALHGRRRELHLLADLAVGEALELAHHDDPVVGVRQLVERAAEVVEALACRAPRSPARAGAPRARPRTARSRPRCRSRPRRCGRCAGTGRSPRCGRSRRSTA